MVGPMVKLSWPAAVTVTVLPSVVAFAGFQPQVALADTAHRGMEEVDSSKAVSCAPGVLSSSPARSAQEQG
jgi:hypothetical protein